MDNEMNFLYSSEYADCLINTLSEPLIVLDHDLRVMSANRSFF